MNPSCGAKTASVAAVFALSEGFINNRRGVRGVLASVIAVAVVACGGVRTSPGSAVRVPSRDEAVELAQALPAGGELCVVARPGLVSDTRKALFRRVSQASGVAWLGTLAPVAVASTRSEAQGHAELILVRTLASDEDVHRVLAAQPWMDVRWDGAPDACEPSRRGCVHARWVRPGVLELRVGRWPATARADACAALAEAHPEALEVSLRSGALEPGGFLEDDATFVAPPLGRTRIVHDTGESLRMEYLTQYDPESTEEPVETLARGEREIEGPMLDPVRRVLRTRTRLLWEDLQLELEDDERLRRARAYEAQLSEPADPEQVDVADLVRVDEQIALRAAQMEPAPPQVRRLVARALARLLERVVEAHPERVVYARRLVTLLLVELDRPEDAARIAAGVLTRVTDPGAMQEWRLTWRGALARAGSPDFAAALVTSGIVDDSDAPRAARELMRLVARGQPYDLAEGAWLADRALTARAERLVMQPARAELPLDALVPTLAALLDAGRPNGLEDLSFYVQLRATPEDVPLIAGDGRSLTVLESTEGPRLLVASARDGLWSAGTPTVRRVRPGSASVIVAAVPVGGALADGASALRLEGQVVGDSFVVERASARLDWARVDRFVARPLAQLGADLVLDAETPSLAARLARLNQSAGNRCEPEGARLACRDAVYAGDRRIRVVTRVATEVLRVELRRLW